MVVEPEKIVFIVFYNDLIDYFIVCFEHQCNKIRAFLKAATRMVVDEIGVVL